MDLLGRVAIAAVAGLLLAAPAGCVNIAAMTDASTMAPGEYEIVAAISLHPEVVKRTGNFQPGLSPNIGIRWGVADFLEMGLRLGLPTGVLFDTKFSLYEGERVRLAVMPVVGSQLFGLQHKFNFVQLELPVLLDIPFDEHAFVLVGRYGAQWYWEATPAASPWAHYAGGEVAFAIKTERHLILQPYVSVAHIFEGKFVDTDVRVNVGMALRFR